MTKCMHYLPVQHKPKYKSTFRLNNKLIFNDSNKFLEEPKTKQGCHKASII